MVHRPRHTQDTRPIAGYRIEQQAIGVRRCVEQQHRLRKLRRLDVVQHGPIDMQAKAAAHDNGFRQVRIPTKKPKGFGRFDLSGVLGFRRRLAWFGDVNVQKERADRPDVRLDTEVSILVLRRVERRHSEIDIVPFGIDSQRIAGQVFRSIERLMWSPDRAIRLCNECYRAVSTLCRKYFSEERDGIC